MLNLINKFLSIRNGLASRYFFVITHAKNMMKRNTAKKSEVFLRINELKDRHLYLLAEFFIQAGYFVYMVGSIEKIYYYNDDPYYSYIFSSKNIKHVAEIFKSSLPNALLCTDHELDPQIASWFSKIVFMNYDIDIPPNTNHSALFLPYLMHPNVYRSGQLPKIPELRGMAKNMGIFFAGNLKEQYARTSWLLRHYGTRFAAVNYVLRRFKERVRLFTTRETLLQALREEDLVSSIVVFDATTERLGREEWFPVLAQSRFFLALPGVVMPMCHNVVEAMALGVVPILGYGQLFSPCLKSGSVCLGYASETDLAQAIELALGMDATAHDQMRRRTMEHFDRHMVPSSFLDQLWRGQGKCIEMRYPAEFISENVSKAKNLASGSGTGPECGPGV